MRHFEKGKKIRVESQLLCVCKSDFCTELERKCLSQTENYSLNIALFPVSTMSNVGIFSVEILCIFASDGSGFLLSDFCWLNDACRPSHTVNAAQVQNDSHELILV